MNVYHKIFFVLCPLVLTVKSILAAVYRIDLSGTPCSLGVKFQYKTIIMQIGPRGPIKYQ